MGAVACTPGLVSVYIVDTPPVFPGYSVSDVITFEFSKPTAQPGPRAASFLNFTPPIDPSFYEDLWTDNGRVLELKFTDVSFFKSTEERMLQYEAFVLKVRVDGDNITDADRLSGSMVDVESRIVRGSWGAPSQPSIFFLEAVNSGTSAGLNNGDKLRIYFDQAVSYRPANCNITVCPLMYGGSLNMTMLNSLLRFSAVAWSNISGV